MAVEYAVFEKAPLTALRCKKTTSASNELTPRTGKKFVLDEILASGPSYADIYVGTRLIMRVPIAKNDCTFTPAVGSGAPSAGILNFIRRYIHPGFITATPDLPLTVEFDSAPTLAEILYYELPIEKKMEPEITGVEDELPTVLAVTHSEALDATGTYNFDTAKMPTGAFALVNGSRVPANVEFLLKALAFAAKAEGSTEFTYLHLWAQDVELFTPEDHVGLPVATANNMLKFDVAEGIAFILSEAYAYRPGYLITIKADGSYDGTNTLAAESAYLYLFGTVRRLGGA